MEALVEVRLLERSNPPTVAALSTPRWQILQGRQDCLIPARNRLHQGLQTCRLCCDLRPGQSASRVCRRDQGSRTSCQQSAMISYDDHVKCQQWRHTNQSKLLKRPCFKEAQNIVIFKLISKILDQLFRVQTVLSQALHECVVWIAKDGFNNSGGDVSEPGVVAPLVRGAEECDTVGRTANGGVLLT